MAIKTISRSTAAKEADADADTNGRRSVSARHCWQGYTNAFREIRCAIGGPDGVVNEGACRNSSNSNVEFIRPER